MAKSVGLSVNKRYCGHGINQLRPCPCCPCFLSELFSTSGLPFWRAWCINILTLLDSFTLHPTYHITQSQRPLGKWSLVWWVRVSLFKSLSYLYLSRSMPLLIPLVCLPCTGLHYWANDQWRRFGRRPLARQVRIASLTIVLSLVSIDLSVILSDIILLFSWTAVTKDGKRSAQFEETLLITPTGVEVLTAQRGWKLPLEFEEVAAGEVRGAEWSHQLRQSDNPLGPVESMVCHTGST